ncbi:Nif3-like dinuclear metal center hexameric protein [Haloarcula salina]|uniref:Nif3-like dinuclear metal center hexameric protein n=1 Tax=Haloarcula salina TaxID=1429914 RepID=UPI003C6FC527
MNAGDIASRLDDRLDIDAYADIDASPNGLQVGPASQPVDHVAVAVDAAVETIDRAAEAGADLLVTHHGIVWGGMERVTGSHYRRVAPLIDDDLALYVAHLPLDGHQTLGNAAGVADLLDLGNRAPFGSMGGEHIGQRGTLAEPTTVSELASSLEGKLDTGGEHVQVLDFGPSTVEDVAIVTGSGVDWLQEAAETGADVLVTGEGKQQAYHEAREAGVHVVLAGHYATETFGVQSLRETVADWGLETTYVDCPTGL